MKEYPIIFGAESIRAILEGRKTQTRRVIKPQPHVGADAESFIYDPNGKQKCLALGWRDERDMCAAAFCRYGNVGDHLWVRETWGKIYRGGIFSEVIYKEDRPNSKELVKRWRSPIHMPRLASRLILENTNIRAERLQDITNEDAKAEGVCVPKEVEYAANLATSEFDTIDWTYIDGFAEGWDKLNAKRGFDFASNKWVWVIEFKQV